MVVGVFELAGVVVVVELFEFARVAVADGSEVVEVLGVVEVVEGFLFLFGLKYSRPGV